MNSLINKQDDKDEYTDEEEDETRFVIKRQNTFMCFSTKKLKCLDIVNCLAPGCSYDKYMKVYGCELQKGDFPYEFMDGIRKLEDRATGLVDMWSLESGQEYKGH